MAPDTGSYAFAAFDRREEELARLDSQATIAWPLEQQALTGAGLRPGMRVLDLACGSGIITAGIAALAGETGSVTAIDIDAELLASARSRKLPPGSAPVRFVQGDVYNLGLPENEYDFAYARFLFQHLRHPESVLNEVGAVLAPGGIMTIVDVDDGILELFPQLPEFAAFMQLAREQQSRSGGDREVGRKLGYYLQASGFIDIAVRIVVITSEQLGMSSFLDLVTGYKLRQLEGEHPEEARRLLTSIYERTLSRRGFAQIGLYLATGRKS